MRSVGREACDAPAPRRVTSPEFDTGAGAIRVATAKHLRDAAAPVRDAPQTPAND
jgi:hypothetical protein